MKSSEKDVGFLGKETRFEGNLRLDGPFGIDGYIKGKIEGKGNLTIGGEAVIEADIHVSSAFIRGEVHGNITADQRVELQAPAKVFGNIQAPAVVIGEGVIFEGHTKMYHALERATGLAGAGEYQDGPAPNLTAIYGIVKERETGKPIKNAMVLCKGDGKFKTKTNASGYYEVINLNEGKWKLQVDADGFRKEKSVVLITGEGAYEKHLELDPK